MFGFVIRNRLLELIYFNDHGLNSSHIRLIRLILVSQHDDFFFSLDEFYIQRVF